MPTAFCECEHISHVDDGPGHEYGAILPVEPTQLRDMGIWNLCKSCQETCHGEYLSQWRSDDY